MTITDTAISTPQPGADSVDTASESAAEAHMTATVARRPWLPAVSMVLAVVAVVLSVFALTKDTSDPAAPNAPTAVSALPAAIDPPSNAQLPGCNLGSGACDAVAAHP